MNLREASIKLLKEEEERRRNVLKKVLEDHGWALGEQGVDNFLEVIDEFNKKVVE